jgi:hypothetical protein
MAPDFTQAHKRKASYHRDSSGSNSILASIMLIFSLAIHDHVVFVSEDPNRMRKNVKIAPSA